MNRLRTLHPTAIPIAARAFVAGVRDSGLKHSH
jgi:hypothetical protein